MEHCLEKIKDESWGGSYQHRQCYAELNTFTVEIKVSSSDKTNRKVIISHAYVEYMY